MPYLTPPSVRARAKQRTDNLGLSSLDIDTDDGEKNPESSIIPESLRRPKNTVSSLLAASPETNAQIRLDSLATAFLEPLQQLKGKRQFFASNAQFSSLDCLALGYLSLMLVPDLPQPWLARTLRKKFPELCAWTEELGKTVFGPPVSVEDAFTIHEKISRTKNLPWKTPNNRGIIGVGGVFMSSMADTIPVVGQLRRNTRMRQHGGKTPGDDGRSTSWQTIAAVASVIAGLGLAVGYMFNQGMLSFSSTEEAEQKRRSPGLGALGEAGAALSVYASQMDAEVQRQRLQEANYTHGAPVAEVDIEVGRDGVRSIESIN